MNFDEILVDGRNVADRGSFVIPPGTFATTFKVDNLAIEIEFHGGGTEPSLTSRREGDGKVVFSLGNFVNPLGTSIVMPGVLTKKGRTYDLHMMIHALGEGSITRLLSYSLIEGQ